VDGDIYLQSSAIQDVDGSLVTYFPVQSVLKGSGAIAKYSFQNFGEPLFLTKYGIQTITTRDLTNREYEQTRGDRVNKKLLAEANLQNAVSAVYGDYYMLFINGNVYVLDRLQRQYEPNAATSEFQYSGYYWNNIQANCMFADDILHFGTTTGKVYRFYTADEAASYNDKGEAISAVWEFPQFVGNLFWRNKSFKRIFLKLKEATSTGAAIDVQVGGIWQTIMEDYTSTGYLDFEDKLRINNVDKIAFRVRNDMLNQPFGIDSFGFIFAEKGINKGDG
jgi:hypothetical protein